MLLLSLLLTPILAAPASPATEPLAVCVVAGRPARLSACVPEVTSSGTGRLFFRDSASPHWYFVEATAENGCGAGVIPAPGTRLKRVAYYVELATPNGTRRSRERSVRIVSSPNDCMGRPMPTSNVEPSSVGATAGAPLTPKGFGAEAVRRGAPTWVLGSAAAAAAGGAVVALSRDGGSATTEETGAPREPTARPASPLPTPPTATPTPEPPPPSNPRRAPTPTPEPEQPPPPPPPPPPTTPTPRARATATSKPTATPKPTDTPKPTATPKPTDTPKPTATPRPRSNFSDEGGAQATVQWRSVVNVAGARARLVTSRGAVLEAAGGVAEGTLVAEPGENQLEITVMGAVGSGTCRLTLAGSGIVPGSLRVLAGEAMVEGQTVVLHVRGRPGETAVIAFRGLQRARSVTRAITSRKPPP